MFIAISITFCSLFVRCFKLRLYFRWLIKVHLTVAVFIQKGFLQFHVNPNIWHLVILFVLFAVINLPRMVLIASSICYCLRLKNKSRIENSFELINNISFRYLNHRICMRGRYYNIRIKKTMFRRGLKIESQRFHA